MARRGTVAVKYTGDNSDLKRANDDVHRQLRKLGDDVTGFSKATSVGFAAVGAGALLMGKNFVNAASDLNETLSKSNAVFKENAGEIESWSDTAAESFGQSKQEALSAASSFGNMFDQLEIGGDQAAEMSTTMTELASDFASFHNADITEVLEAQSAAFRGEYDAVQRFVPTINAAAVEQKALEMGLAKTTGELTAQDKALATYQLLLDGAGKALGDFDRTSGGLANQQRILSAQWKDMQADLGAALMPAMQGVVGVGSELLGVFNALPDGVQATVVQGAALVAGLIAIAGTASFAIDHLRNMKANLGGLVPDLRNAEGGFTRMGAALGLIGFVGAATGAGMFAESITESRIELDAFVASLATADAAQQRGMGALLIVADRWGHLDAKIKEAAASNIVGAERMIDAAEAAGMSGDRIAQLREIIESKRGTDVQAAVDQKTNADAMRDATAAAEGQTQSLQDLANQMRAMFDPLFAAINAEQQLASAQKAAADAARDHGAGSQEAAAANRQAVQAALAYESSLYQLKGAVESGNVSVAEAVGTLNRWAREGKITADQARQIAAEFGAIDAKSGPVNKRVNVHYSSTGDLASDITAGKRSFGAASGGPVPQHLATGGIAGPRGSDTVPAWLTPGEYVINRGAAQSLGRKALEQLNNGRLPVMGGWGGGQAGRPVVVIHAPITIEGSLIHERDIPDLIRQELERVFQRNGYALNF